MLYGLEITQITEEGEQIVAVDAEGEVDENSACLKYNFDDADYELILENGRMTQRRKGDVNIFMQFLTGEETPCTLADGDNCGTFTVFTQKLSVKFEGGGCTADCIYTDAERITQTRLIIKIYAI